MQLTDLIGPDAILLRRHAVSKRQALDIVAHQAASETGLPERTIVEALLERERLGSTAVGRGIALPHGKLDGLARLHGTLLTLDRPVPFDAVDDQPVDLVFLLLAPETSGAEHLTALGRVSRILRDRATCDRLRAATDPGDARIIMVRAAGQA